jgi:hypothetical protein
MAAAEATGGGAASPVEFVSACPESAKAMAAGLA